MREEYHELSNIWFRKLIWEVKAQTKDGTVLGENGTVSSPGSKRAKLNQVKDGEQDTFPYAEDSETVDSAWGWYSIPEDDVLIHYRDQFVESEVIFENPSVLADDTFVLVFSLEVQTAYKFEINCRRT